MNKGDFEKHEDAILGKMLGNDGKLSGEQLFGQGTDSADDWQCRVRVLDQIIREGIIKRIDESDFDKNSPHAIWTCR